MARTATSSACSSLRFTGLSSLLGTSSVRLSLRNEINCSGGCRRCERITLVRYSPPCITARRGGCVIKKCCEATEADAAGVVFLWVLNRKTTPASRNLLDRSATPPCTDARRGIRSILIRSYLDRAPLQGRVSNEA